MSKEKIKDRIVFRENCVKFTKRLIKKNGQDEVSKTMTLQLARLEAEIKDLKKKFSSKKTRS